MERCCPNLCRVEVHDHRFPLEVGMRNVWRITNSKQGYSGMLLQHTAALAVRQEV